MSHATTSYPTLRLCTIAKKSTGDEYGFNLHAEKNNGQYIGDIDVDSPADNGGLRRGDRIVAINGHSVMRLPHKEVVQFIKQDPMQCTMLVIDEDGYKWYVENEVELKADMPNVERVTVKGSEVEIKASTRHVEQVSITTASTASIATHSQRSVVMPAYPKDVDTISFMDPFDLPPPALDVGSLAGNLAVVKTRTLVMDGNDVRVETVRPLTVDVHAEPPTHTEPDTPPPMYNGHSTNQHPMPTLCRLSKTQHDDEFGFNLHAEGKGHFVGKVDEDSIASLAGLVLGQRIVGVNHTLIYPDTPHPRVVSLIRNDPMTTELLVASEAVDDYYKQRSLPFSFDQCHVYDHDSRPPVTPVPSVTHHEDPVPVSNGHIERDVDHRPVHSVKSSTGSRRTSSSSASSASHTSSTGDVHVINESMGTVTVTTNGGADHEDVIELKRRTAEANAPQVEAPILTNMAPLSNGNAVPHHYNNGHSYKASNGSSKLSLSIPADDPFSKSAKEMRALIANSRRKDPKMDSGLTMAQKHEYIENM